MAHRYHTIAAKLLQTPVLFRGVDTSFILQMMQLQLKVRENFYVFSTKRERLRGLIHSVKSLTC